MVFSWIELVLGLWLILSPWLLGFSSITVMKWSNVLVGLVFVLVNAWVIFGAKVGGSQKA